MFKKVIIRSGQFLIDTNNIELDPDRFRILVEDALSIYNRFVPYDEHVYVDGGAQRAINLTPQLMKGLTGKSYLGTPDWVSDANPSRLFGVNPYFIFKNLDPKQNPYLIEKSSLPWRYRKPTIYLPVSAEWDLHCVWKHRVVEDESESGFSFDVPTLEAEDADKFIKLLQGMFLQGVGRSRRAFTMSDLPILMDGSEITSEGIEIEREATDDLENVQKFWLSW
jgi:hypothetical protein